MNAQTWIIWDEQEAKRLARKAEDQAYIELNNLYLAIEAGTIKITGWHYNRLHQLLREAYPRSEEVMRNYWLREMESLPGYLEA